MKKNRVLLVGSSFSAMPLFSFLKKSGYEVAVCGGYKDDPCHIYADKSFFVDYSKKEELLKLCKKERFDFIVPSCNDYAYNSSSYVSSKLKRFSGFDEYKTTMKLHTKNGFRELMENLKLSSPRILKYDKHKEELNYPILVKPNISFSGIGIKKISNKKDFYKIIKEIDTTNITIEEFVDGSLHSHSAFISNGKICIDFFVDEFCKTYPYQVDTSFMSKKISNKIRDKIREEITILIKSLNLNDGLLHTQFIANKDKFWLIETMRRCPGDLYGELIRKTSGFDYVKAYCDPFLKKNISNPKSKTREKFVLRHTISMPRKIRYKSFKHTIPSDEVEFFPLKESAYVLEKAPFDKTGIIFAEFKSKKLLIKNAKEIKKHIKIEKY